MSKPVWSITQSSNTSLGTFIERKTLGVGDIPLISLQVTDPENVDNIQTNQFKDNVETYGKLNEVYIKSNGLAREPYYLEKRPGAELTYGKYKPAAQSYVFKFPTLRPPLTKNDRLVSTFGDVGVAIDGVPFRSPNSGIVNVLNGTGYTENKVIFRVQGYFTDGSGIIDQDGKYYYHSDPTRMYTKNPAQHSPILGFAFDGLPIYGPFGYSNPLDVNSGIRVITSSYRTKESNRSNTSMPDGSYIEDFEYVQGLGDLDQYNTRFCKTPEYPNGIQAYFVTVDPLDLNLPRYPYVVGPYYWGVPILPNDNFTWPGKIDVSLISGKLPGGLRIEDLNIVGTPFAVVGAVTYRFVLRAKNLDGLSDRTFTIKIASENQSITWATPTGLVPVGTNNQYYILDNSPIDFQLDAIDPDLPNGKYLDYHIPPNGGELPGGISLSKTGKLSGFTAPILSLGPDGTLGKYDANIYDSVLYDYGLRPLSGYDSFYYDNQTYDYSIGNRAPKKLNRYYQFKVRASDGIRYVDRIFKIYVVGDDYFRADNTILGVGTNTFTADNTYIRKPIWITSKYIGRLRANNYITIILDVYDSATVEGSIGYLLAPVNDEAVAKKVTWNPSGSDKVNSLELTVNPTDLTGIIEPGYYVDAVGIPKDARVLTWVPATGKLTIHWSVAITVSIGINQIVRIGTQSILPPNMVLDQLSGEVYGSVPYQPAITKTYKFTVNAFRYNYDPTIPNEFSLRTFTVDVIGEIDSVIRFTTTGDLGFINANFISNLSVNAVTNVKGAVLSYSLKSGKLPPGLKLINDGTIQGKVNQYSKNERNKLITFDKNTTRFDTYTTVFDATNKFVLDEKPGLITFDNNTMTIDGLTTTFDRKYTFTIESRDQFNESATTKTFKLVINTPNNKLYSNIHVKPFLRSETRMKFNDFFNNSTIFESNKIYRQSDPEFGIQNEFKMLFYPGIETKSIASYVSAFGRSSRKRFRIGNLKTAIAKNPGTNDVVYEVVYLEIIDNLENENGSISEYINTFRLNHPISINQGSRNKLDNDINSMTIDALSSILIQDKVMTADFDGQFVSDLNKSTIFGNSTTNIRKKIASVGDTERNYLPLWMRTPQSFSGVEQGFTKAVPICYCIPGYANEIILNIKNSTIDFKRIDYTVDRVIIDSVVGETGDKYITFPVREVIND